MVVGREEGGVAVCLLEVRSVCVCGGDRREAVKRMVEGRMGVVKVEWWRRMADGVGGGGEVAGRGLMEGGGSENVDGGRWR